MSDFIKAMTGGKPGSVPLTEHSEIRENAKVLSLAAKHMEGRQGRTVGRDLRRRGQRQRSLTGGCRARRRKAGYISTRLKVVTGGRIIDVEISADTSARVVPDYVWKLDPQFADVLRPDQRMSRADLEALGRRYFHSLSSHVAIAADFDERCERFHSGQRVTNTASNTVEGGPPRTCAGSLEGNPQWGPATEQRFPVIDPERGVVLGVTMLHYPRRPNLPVMYVSEVFKVVSGKIVRIDNIGLMMQGVTTLGFTH